MTPVPDLRRQDDEPKTAGPQLKYGRIAGNTAINATIYRCFAHIADDDAEVFVRRFRDQIAADEQVLHTFRELLVGGYLASHGFTVRYDRETNGQTPDWSIVTADGTLTGLLEVVNFHTTRAMETQITQNRADGKPWIGVAPSHVERLYDRVREKAAKYKAIVEQARVPYVVAVFSDFAADVDLEEVDQCLFDEHNGLCLLYPTISGLLFFKEERGHYLFTYIASQSPAANLVLPSGTF